MTNLVSADFLRAFFGEPNVAWPECDSGHPTADFLKPFLSSLEARDERPLVLPYKPGVAEPTVVYVACWDAAHASRLRPQLEASVAHAWCSFDGRTAVLRPDHAAERSLLELVGPGTTYRLQPSAATHAQLWAALRRLVTTIESRPSRLAHIPRPIGRLLRDFEAALGTGQAEASKAILEEIERSGGVSLENVAFLSIRRMSQLGDDQGLLAHPSLDDIVRAEPPHLVRDEILAGWSRQRLGGLGEGRSFDVEQALGVLRACSLPLGLLVDDSPAGPWSQDAALVVGLVALVRSSPELASRLLERHPHLPEGLLTRLGQIGAPAAPSESLVAPPSSPKIDAAAPTSWSEWVGLLTEGDGCPLGPDLVESWPAAHEEDAALADHVMAVPDSKTDELLAVVGFFVDADRFLEPAWRSAGALIERFLVADRLGPADLGSITALLEICLRGGPPEAYYRDLLDGIQAFAARWVSVAQPSTALDMVDVVAAGPKPDVGAAAGFGSVLLEPLHAQRRRLSLPMVTLADLMTADLGLDWDWTPSQEESPPSPQQGQGLSGLLLYSLDRAVLRRVASAVSVFLPDVTIHTSSATEGSARLRDQVRRADLVVMATRCATHAATGFITDNMQADATLVYPDGSGSASMIRAIEGALREGG